MSTIYFNPWKTLYKKPFGASICDQVIQFQIRVTEPQVTNVYLVIHKDFGETMHLLLTAGQDSFYSGEYCLNQGKGLYFYHFEIQVKDQAMPLFYGAYQGGEGRIESNRKNLWEFQITCYQTQEISATWYREAVFYQIFPDRFFNGNPNQIINQPKANTFLYATPEDQPMYIKNPAGEILRWDFFGGNLKGIQAKIPYLKELGITAIYLNPIFEANSNHRYDTSDYFMIDPILGTLEDFEALIEALQVNGIRVMLDGVFSHVGQNSRYFNRDGSYGLGVGAYHNPKSPYFSWFQFIKYPDQYQSWWGIEDLPTIDKWNTDFQQMIYGSDHSVIDYWTKRGVDAWRLDVADELPDLFIQGIRERLNQYSEKVLIGEVWEDASNKISYQQRRQYLLGEHLQGVMNYPLRSAILALLNQTNTTEQIARMLTTLIENYPNAVLYNNLNSLGTHDTERILTMLDQDLKKLNLAFAILFYFIGVPCVYYGDEAGLTGHKDPENRQFFPWKQSNLVTLAICKKWIAVRKENPILIEGTIDLFYTSNLFGILRVKGNDYEALIVNPTSQAQSISEALVFMTEPAIVGIHIQEKLQGATIAAFDCLRLVK